MPVPVPARLGPRREIEAADAHPVIIDQNRRSAGGTRHAAPLAAGRGAPICICASTREINMFTGLKRSILIIVASVTVLPWGVMQLVQ
jgi:hypothetical protein